MLKELYEVIHNALITNLQFIALFKLRGVIKSLQTYDPMISISRIG